MTDEEIFMLLQKETVAAVTAGQVIDMGTTGLDYDEANNRWTPEADKCPRCVLGMHMAGRSVLAQPVPGYYPSLTDDVAVEFNRSRHWAEGLFWGTTPDEIAPSGEHPDTLIGWALGRDLLGWVRATYPEAM